MTQNDREIEVKFLLARLPALEERVRQAGGVLVQARVLETNLRFDTPDGRLSAARQVLRLRQDTAARLTFKGPVEGKDFTERQEIEFVVSDGPAARRFLQALGYQVRLAYEKYRATYRLGETLVMLDETPIGAFVELEGPDVEALRQAAGQLGLAWDRRIVDSYAALFERARQALQLAAKNLTFAELDGVVVPGAAMGIGPADETNHSP